MQPDWLVPGDEELIEAAVRDAESITAAELVVVLARRAEEYRDVPLHAAVLSGLGVLGAMLHHPASFHPSFIVLDVALTSLLVFWLARRAPGLVRWLTAKDRRRRAAERAARLAFVDHSVTATRDRTGILLHYTGLEARLTILPDFGVQGKVPAARFHAIVAQFEKERTVKGLGPALATAIRAVGPAVSAEVPRRPDDVNELPDRPRVES